MFAAPVAGKAVAQKAGSPALHGAQDLMAWIRPDITPVFARCPLIGASRLITPLANVRFQEPAGLPPKSAPVPGSASKWREQGLTARAKEKTVHTSACYIIQREVGLPEPAKAFCLVYK